VNAEDEALMADGATPHQRSGQGQGGALEDARRVLKREIAGMDTHGEHQHTKHKVEGLGLVERHGGALMSKNRPGHSERQGNGHPMWPDVNPWHEAALRHAPSYVVDHRARRK
jgi:hypothetical protein